MILRRFGRRCSRLVSRALCTSLHIPIVSASAHDHTCNCSEQKTRVARRRAEESAQNEVLLSTYDEKCQFYTAMIHEYRNQLEEVIARSLKIPQQQQQQQYHDDDFNMHLDGENVILDREHMESETLVGPFSSIPLLLQ